MAACVGCLVSEATDVRKEVAAYRNSFDSDPPC